MLCVFCGFSKRQEKEKKNREGQKTVFKNKTTKKARVFNNNNNNNNTTTTTTNNRKISLQNFSSHSSREKERKKDAFSSGELPESGIYYSFSLCSFVLRSFSSAFCSRRLVFVFVFVRELKRNWKRCRSRSRNKFSL